MAEFVGMGEMSSSDANPETVEALFTSMVPAGKMQVCTMPKNKNVSLDNSAAFTQLVRATIAHSYAVGGHVVSAGHTPVYRSLDLQFQLTSHLYDIHKLDC